MKQIVKFVLHPQKNIIPHDKDSSDDENEDTFLLED